MKLAKLSLILVAAAAVMFGLSGTSFAFHSGGVAECMGCHEMHNAASPTNLLQGPDNSSTCLNCHNAADTAPNGEHISTDESILAPGRPPSEMTPGGDFGWLKKSYLFTVLGSVITDAGQTHGHNIVAVNFNYVTDPDNTVAPGGSNFPSPQLACTSCHDMHGKGRWLTTGSYAKTGEPIYTSGSYGAIPSTVPSNLATGVYRMLRAGDTVDGATFPATPPVAVAPSTYNRSEFFTQTRVAYSYGMSPFCGTCHPDMHSSAGIYRHPQDQVMSGTVPGNYNSYVKSGIMTGSPTTSYLSLVPFEEGLTYSPANIATLKSHAQTNDSNLNGPGSGTVPATTQVMCLSCHRAHATGFAKMMRWNNGSEFIVYNGLYPGTDSTPTVPEFARGRNSTETAASYYNRNVTTFATYQRSLCNKCHAQD
jgi:predicted CXXCH cytochrome family protein